MEEYTRETLNEAQRPVLVQNPEKFEDIEDLFIPTTADRTGIEWQNYYERLPDDVVVLSDPLGLPMNSRGTDNPWDSVVDLLEQTDQMDRFAQKYGRYHDIRRHLNDGFEGVKGQAGVTPWMYEEELKEFDQQLTDASPEKLEDTRAIIPNIQRGLSHTRSGRNDLLPDINYAVWTGGSYGVSNAVAYDIPESHDLYQVSFQLMNQKILEDDY